jgi:hypothetical protein
VPVESLAEVADRSRFRRLAHVPEDDSAVSADRGHQLATARADPPEVASSPGGPSERMREGRTGTITWAICSASLSTQRADEDQAATALSSARSVSRTASSPSHPTASVRSLRGRSHRNDSCALSGPSHSAQALGGTRDE